MKITNHYIKSIKLLLIISVLFFSCKPTTTSKIDGIYEISIESKKPEITKIKYAITNIKDDLYNVSIQALTIDKKTQKTTFSHTEESQAFFSKESKKLRLVKGNDAFFVFLEDLKSFKHGNQVLYKNKNTIITEEELNNN